MSERHTDLVEPEGVNAGSAGGERDRLPDGEVPASAREPIIPPVRPADGELVGVPGQVDGTPGQTLEAGEG
jgi:hypothetical protein